MDQISMQCAGSGRRRFGYWGFWAGLMLAGGMTPATDWSGFGKVVAKTPLTAAVGGLAANVGGYGVGTSASNKDVARRFIAAMPTGDANALRSVMASDARLSLRLAGVYSPELHAFRNGIDWDREELIKMSQDRAKAMKGSLTVKILSMISDGDHVAAEVIAQGVRADNDHSYIQHFSYHFQIRHRKIVDVRLYEDTFHEWDVWQNPGISTAAFKPPMLPKKASPLVLPRVVTAEQLSRNKAAIRRWAAALPSRDADGIRAELAPDVVWSFAMGGDYAPAIRSFPGTYSMGREGMIKLQTGFQVDLREPFTFDIYSLIAEGSDVCAELVGVDVGKEGHAYRQHYSIHFKMRDGKIVEGHVYQDTLHQFDLATKQAGSVPIFSPIHPAR